MCCMLLSMMVAPCAPNPDPYAPYYAVQVSQPIFGEPVKMCWGGVCEWNYYSITGYALLDVGYPCVECTSATQYKSGCAGYSAGSCVDCSTAGSAQYLEPSCTKWADSTVKECSAKTCGVGEYRKGCNTCTSYTTCTAGQYELTTPTSTTDRQCQWNVLCKTCLGTHYLLGCGGASSGTCTLCEACIPTMTPMPGTQCRADGTYDCVDEKFTEFLNNDVYISDNTGRLAGVTTKSCTSCGKDQLMVRECRGGDPRHNRICATCTGSDSNGIGTSIGMGTISNCSGMSYTHCSYGEAKCQNCGSCRGGRYMVGCVGIFYSSISTHGPSCVPCYCNSDEYADYGICDGKGITYNRENTCKSCGPYYPQNIVGSYTIDPPTLHWTGHKYCLFSCIAGYYKNGTECVPCSILQCPYGQFQTACPAGSIYNSKCQACTDKACAAGEYHALCPAGGTTDVATICTTCTNIDTCNQGYKLASCATGTRIHDADCQICGLAITDHGISLGDCDWICEEGYYKHETQPIGCVQCITACNDVYPHMEVPVPCTGEQFQDTVCGCKPGSHRWKLAEYGTESCETCTDYMYNDVISTVLDSCTMCPLGHQGNTKDAATHCEPCLKNFFRNASVTQCEYCVAGTGGVRGLWHCPTCPVGEFATDMRLHVWLWNHASNPGWVEYDADSAPNCVENGMVYCAEDIELKWYPTLPQGIPYTMGKSMDEMRYQWNCTSCGESLSVYIH